MMQYEEWLFYPFAACTELVTVLLFLAPGLIPLKRELAGVTKVNPSVNPFSSNFMPTH